MTTPQPITTPKHHPLIHSTSYTKTTTQTTMSTTTTLLTLHPTTTTNHHKNHHHKNHHHNHHYNHHNYPTNPTFNPTKKLATKLHVSSSPTNKPITSQTTKPTQETVFFDGGAHYGDLIANLLLGFTLVWLPLTLAAVSRAFFLRYRFTNVRVTVISGFTGQDRSDFGYNVIKDVKVVPRFVGEWGDIIITLKDGTVVDLRSVPKFREIAKYCLSLADKPVVLKESGAKGF